MLVRAVRSLLSPGRPLQAKSLFTKSDGTNVKVWLPKTHADIPGDYDGAYPKPDEVEPIAEEVVEGDPKGIRVMVETQRVFEAGTPAFEHPEDRGVRLYAKLADLKLDAPDRENLVAILGPRFDVNKRIVKLTSSKYPSPDENTQHCIRMLKELIQSAKDMTRSLAQHSQASAA